MGKSKTYTPHKVTAAKPETVTVTDGKFQPGDRVKLNRSIPIKGGGQTSTGTVRSVKRQGAYEYAVVAMDPYGNILTPSTQTLTKLASKPAKEG